MATSPTFSALYASRCYGDKPVFWVPQRIKSVPYSLFGDEDMPVDPSWGVDKVIQKVIATATKLEIPVGNFISETRKTLNALSPVVMKLLQSNAADEAGHDRGFRYAAEAYPISQQIYDEADLISKQWIEDKSSSLEKAATLEASVFLISLSVLRLAGGSELATLAANVSSDEARHVSTNRGVLAATGIDPSKPSQSVSRLAEDTLSWILDGLKIPALEIGESFDFDKDFLMKSSKSLIETGQAKELDNVIYYAENSSPMEMSNRNIYSRSTEVAA